MAVSDLVMVSMTFTVQIGDAERQIKDMSIHCMRIYIYIFIHVCILFCVYKKSSRSLHKQMDITYRHSVEYL